MSTATTTNATGAIGATEALRPETTISGVKLTFTAKGLLQPEITTRYATADEALAHAVADAFALYDQLTLEAADRGIRLVTDAAEGK